MGRPIKKKFFGNLNTGSGSTGADNGIGGEGVASISVATAGSFVVSNTYKQFPRLVIGAPNLTTGVQATADVVFEIDTVTYSSGGQTDGDYLAGLSTSITGLGGGAVVNIVEVGNKVTAVNLTGGNRGEFRRGDAFDGTGITTFQVLQAPNVGTDLQIAITFRVKSITMVERGSGYTSVPALSWNGHTFTGQTIPSGNTPTLTATQQNAISFTSYLTTGSNAVIGGDIIKQEASRRYLVQNSEGTGQCKLVAAGALAAGQMSIIATDHGGATYYVTKLTARRANLVNRTNTSTALVSIPAGGTAASGWTLGAATGTVVTIANV